MMDIQVEIDRLEEKLSNVTGKETEVYTRIVGYYRSVANWNAGKASEYEKRKEFEVGFNPDMRYLVFTQDRCPNCAPMVRYMESNVEMGGRVIDASVDEGEKLAKEFSIYGTPAVVFLDGEGKEVDRFRDILKIEEYLEKG